jgi:hypothetical protein
MLIQLTVAISLLALVNEWELLQTTLWSNRVERSGWGRVAGIIYGSTILFSTIPQEVSN